MLPEARSQHTVRSADSKACHTRAMSTGMCRHNPSRVDFWLLRITPEDVAEHPLKLSTMTCRPVLADH